MDRQKQIEQLKDRAYDLSAQLKSIQEEAKRLEALDTMATHPNIGDIRITKSCIRVTIGNLTYECAINKEEFDKMRYLIIEVIGEKYPMDSKH